MRKLDYAIEYGRYGFRVLPVIPDSKKPVINGWQNAATRDREKIISWWHENPDYNIGVLVEKPTVVIDVDVKNGRNGFESLKREGIDIEGTDTFTVRTPSGGAHYYFNVEHIRNNEINNGIGVLEGVDIKGSGKGYVRCAGSTIDGEKYEILRGSLAEVRDIPVQLRDLIVKKANPKNVSPVLNTKTDRAASRTAVFHAGSRVTRQISRLLYSIDPVHPMTAGGTQYLPY